jgi:hypothetical protein
MSLKCFKSKCVLKLPLKIFTFKKKRLKILLIIIGYWLVFVLGDYLIGKIINTIVGIHNIDYFINVGCKEGQNKSIKYLNYE